jgi:diguanylate cyclase (GGDEF)-like protein
MAKNFAMIRMNLQAWKGYLSIGLLTLMAYIFHPSILLQSILYMGAGILAITAMLVGLWLFRPQPRTAWIFFVTGQCLNTTADIFFVNQVYFSNPAVPEWLDSIFYSLGSLSFLIGLVFLFIPLRKVIQRNALINGAIVATALFCVIWVIQIYPNLSPAMTLENWIGVTAFPACLVIIGVASSVFLMTPIGNTWSYRFLYLTVLFYGVGLSFYNMIAAVTPLTAALRDGWLPVFYNASYTMAYFCLGTAFLHPSLKLLKRSLPVKESAISLQDTVIIGLAFVLCPLVYWVQRVRGVDVQVGVILVCTIIIFGLMETRLLQLVRALESQNRQMGRQQAQLQYQASHDSLTNLPNRASLDNYLMDMASRMPMPTNGSLSALMMIDLDRFKQVNDTFGHNQGDIVLLQMVDKLLKVKRKEDMVARWGGDEFVFIVENLQSLEDAQAFASRIHHEVRVSIGVGDAQVEVTLSIGGCLFRDGIDDIHAVLKRADIALYHAKSFRDDEKISFFPEDPDNEAEL